MKMEIGKQKAQITLAVTSGATREEMQLGEIELDLSFSDGAIDFSDKKFFGDVADVLRSSIKDLDALAGR